ncbi:MAG: ABC transporter ATP-binding protein, partial [Pseudomonadota bacterium]
MTDNSKVLEIQGLRVEFDVRQHVATVINDLSISLERGEVLGIVGESGCGKSMLALAIMGLIPSPPGRMAAGQILLEGEDLTIATEKRLRQVRGNDVSMIFQEPMTSLNPVFKIGYQIAETLRIHQGLDKKAGDRRAVELLKAVDIPAPQQRSNEYPYQLSGGMRQRVMIAMALACNPKLLIADEPTTALDVTVQAQIFDLLKNFQKQTEAGIIFITHDMGSIAEMADRVAVMYAGRKMEDGLVETVLGNPLHPYTRALISCVPHLEKEPSLERRTLVEIPGVVPSLILRAVGCPFASRCTEVLDRCSHEMPPAFDKGNGHTVACWLEAPQDNFIEVQQAKKIEHQPVAAASKISVLPEGDREKEVLLSVKDLTVQFRRRRKHFFAKPSLVHAVDGVSFNIKQGTTLGLVGESGSGKTTTALAIMRLVDISSGNVTLGGDDITAIHGEALRLLRRRMQFIFQDPYSSLNPHQRAGAIVREPMDLLEVGETAERDSWVSRLFKQVGLRPEQRAYFPHQFSGGQRQRIGVARA